MQITTKLRAEHDTILSLIDEFYVLLSASQPPAGIDLLKFRSGFSKQLLAHLACEDMLLYPRMKQDPNVTVAMAAHAFSTEMGGLLAAYKDWSGRWPSERLQGEWPQFVAETRELLGTIGKRILRENAELYPLVEGRARAA